ncbi:MAG: MFS transporter [Pseudomonadota bacterium]|jgi:MFS family permease|uniref:Major facilitator family transporter n=1 Tax=hydrothermal vent metagenome TaxID=652676 RepID=A0A160TRB3_9ZZZZ
MALSSPENAPQTAPETADALAIRRRRLTLALLTFVYFFSYMDRQILAILLELIRKDLLLTDTQLGILSGFAFAVFYAGLGIPVARLADRTSRKKIIVLSLALWSAMTAICGLATSFLQLLFARIGVGVGEAGSSPPSHSMIADLYAPHERASAMAIYSLGVVLGAAFGTIIGGTIGHFYGWRHAMFVVGLPGLLLAVIVWFFVIEPRRGLSDGRSQAEQEREAMPSLGAGFASIWHDRAARHLVIAVTLTSLIGYGHAQWGPSFIQRSLGVPLLTISWVIAPIGAIFATVSGVVGGMLADRLAKKRGLHWQSWMVAILKTIALPFSLIFYFLDEPNIAVGAYFFALLFASSYLGPTFALLQGLAPMRLRALWAAITLLVINLIGLGLGPTLVGQISDLLRPRFGEDSLRWAMFVFAVATPWAIFHYWRAGVILKQRGQVTGSA